MSTTPTPAISATWLETRLTFMERNYHLLESQLHAVPPDVRENYEAMLLHLSCAEGHIAKVVEHYRRVEEGKLL